MVNDRHRPQLLAEAELSLLVNGKDLPTQNFFKSAEWTPDGTSVVANAEDNHIRTFIMWAFRHFPRDSAEQMRASDPSEFGADWPARRGIPLVSPTTEAHVKPHSLLFSSDGATFLAGSENAITIFDVSRPGSEPLVSLRTGPKRSKNAWTNPGTALRGFVSAMGIDQQYHVLAAGTLSRQVGLYDHGGHGECIGVFSVAGTEADSAVSGFGITQAIWSRCGKYLHLAERKSNGTMVYDIRKTGQLLSWTGGRNAMTNQRMKVELAMSQGTGEEDIVAGGTDGCVRRWNAPHLRGGAINCDSATELYQSPVNSIGVHQLGNVLLTANGSRNFESPVQSSRLRLWTLP